jgi:predicted Zn-dependent protease
MMTKWLFWLLLSRLTGSPILSLVALLALYWALDRFTLQLLPSPVRLWARWRRAGHLQRLLETNPHDRRARYELADLWVARGRYADAVAVLKPNLEAGDEDVATLYLLGVAYLGAGQAAQGELLLNEAERLEPGYGLGAIDLARGRSRLARGELTGDKGALAALERFCRTRSGTVEGRVLLARALERAGNDGEAALAREAAWMNYRAAPGFQRRRERLWAWRARPSRPLAYAAALGLALLLGTLLVSRLQVPEPAAQEPGWAEEGE